MSENGECQTCKHCRAVKIPDEYGGGEQCECHYNPPTALTGFYRVRSNDWCREYEEKMQ